VNRILHWAAGLSTGYLCFVNLGAAILLAFLFNFFQCANEYATPGPLDFKDDIWDYMFSCFLGAGIGLVLFYI